MAEPTNTRKTLRRAIAAELRMPFFRRFAAGESTTDTSSTTGSLVDSVLNQPDGFWNGQWYYMLGTEEVGVVRSFRNTSHSFSMEPGLAAAPADSGDLYEIHAVFNAVEIHEAINRALDRAGRVFTETVEDKTLVIKENVLEYSLSGLSRTVFVLGRVFVENPGTVIRGTASAGGAASITVESVPSDIDTNWKISIYGGTGAGQIRDYASNVGNVIAVLAWTTTPDSTSKYAMWDASEELYDWIPVAGFYQDAREFPDYLRMRSRWPQYYGLRMRLSYESLPVSLSTDASTTAVPKDFVVNQAIAFLHQQRRGNPKADMAYHEAQRQAYQDMADSYMAINAPARPNTTIAVYNDVMYRPNSDDPLGWNEW